MNVLFMGTPDFAVPCMEALMEAGHKVVGAVTQPDKPKGRGHKLTPPPVKVRALEKDVEVFQPDTLKDNALLPVLERLQPDVIVVVAYGKFLPVYVLEYPVFGCINVHASLLPKYRGAGPIQWAVIHGEKETGVTTMHMAKGMDTGDMILKSSTVIRPDETAGELHDRLSLLGAELAVETLKQLEAGTAPREAQRDEDSTYAPMISKETGRIDWNRQACEILDLIRGTNPWPLSYTTYQGEPFKIIRGTMAGKSSDQPGSIRIADRQILVACGDGNAIRIEELQAKGCKRMDAASYLNGHSLDENIRFE